MLKAFEGNNDRRFRVCHYWRYMLCPKGKRWAGYRILNSGSMISTHFMRTMRYWSDFTAFQSQTIHCPKWCFLHKWRMERSLSGECTVLSQRFKAYHQFQTNNESALSYKTLYSIIRNLLYSQHKFSSNFRYFPRKVNTEKSKYTAALVGWAITSIGKGQLPGEAQ